MGSVRTVLVTGGARRIGRALCLAFARAGWRVLIHCSRSLEQARELHGELGGDEAGHRILRCDFLQPGAIAGMMEAIPEEELPECLVNNASEYSRIPFPQASPGDVLRTFTVNAFAPMELMRAFARRAGRGSIINMTDQRTAMADPDAGPYALAKKTLAAATEAFALEYAPDIRVNAIAPGLVLPPPGVPAERMEPLLAAVPLGRRTTEEELCAACLFLADSPGITGQTIFVDGGMHLLGHAIESGPHSGR